MNYFCFVLSSNVFVLITENFWQIFWCDNWRSLIGVVENFRFWFEIWFINKIMLPNTDFSNTHQHWPKKSQTSFNAIFAIFEVLALLWKTFIKSNWPREIFTHVTYKVFNAVLFLVCCQSIYLKRHCHPIQDKTIPETKANPWNYYVMGLKRCIKLIIKKRFIHIRLTSTKKTDR